MDLLNIEDLDLGHDHSQQFVSVLQRYMPFLDLICNEILNERNINRNRRKYEAVKKELYNYLIRHIKYFTVHFCHYQLKGKTNKIICPIKFNYSGTCEQFLKFDNFFKYFKANKKVVQGETYTVQFIVTSKVDKIESRMWSFLRKPRITNEDVKKFFKTHFLVHRGLLKTKLSNYNDLAAHVKRRVECYMESAVSFERIDEMSFVYKGHFKGLKGEKWCAVCMEEYEKGREVCAFPCQHFCCRKCAEQMFNVRKAGSSMAFCCHICKDDCT